MWGGQAEFEALKPTMAKQYPFELDTFQKAAVLHLERVRANALTALPMCGGSMDVR